MQSRVLSWGLAACLVVSCAVVTACASDPAPRRPVERSRPTPAERVEEAPRDPAGANDPEPTTDPVPGDPGPSTEPEPSTAPDASSDPVPSTDPDPSTDPVPGDPEPSTDPDASSDPVVTDPVASTDPEPSTDPVPGDPEPSTDPDASTDPVVTDPVPGDLAPVDSGDPAPVDSGSPATVDSGDPAPVDSGDPAIVGAGDPAPVDSGSPAAIDSEGVAAIDSVDLTALATGPLAGAGLDVPDTEPEPPARPVARVRFVGARSSLDEGEVADLQLVLELEGGDALPTEARVTITHQGGSARAGADWSFGAEGVGSAVVTFPAGSADGAEASVSVVAAKDSAVEGPETALFALEAQDPEHAWALDWSASPGGYALTLRDAQEASVAFLDSHVEASEADGRAALTVRLSLPPGCALEHSVTARVHDARSGTARAELDYRFSAIPVVFPAGSVDGAEEAVEVELLDDEEHEPQEGVVLELNAQRGPATRGEPARCMLSILDDDVPVLSFAALGEVAAVSSELVVEVVLHVPGGGALHSPYAIPLQARAGAWASEVTAAFPVGAGDGARQALTLQLPALEDAEELSLVLGDGEAQSLGLDHPEPAPAEPVVATEPVVDRDLVSLAITTGFVAVIFGALTLLIWQLRVLLQPPPPMVKEDDDLFVQTQRRRATNSAAQGLPGAFIQSRYRDPTAPRPASGEVDAFFDSLMETHDEESAPTLAQIEEDADGSDEGAIGARDLLAALQRRADESDAARLDLPRVVVIVRPLEPSETR